MFENIILLGLTSKIFFFLNKKNPSVNFVNKNAGLKERSAPKPTIPPEEAEPYPWLEDQVLEGPGKHSSDADQMHLSCKVAQIVVSRIMFYP